MEQMAQNMKKAKGKGDVPMPQREITGYVFRIIFAPSLTSDAIGS